MNTRLVFSERLKIFLVGAMCLLAVPITVHYYRFLHEDRIFSHFYYIPSFLSCIWWRRFGLVIPAALCVLMFFMHFFFAPFAPYLNDITRTIIIMSGSLTAVIVSETLAAERKKLQLLSRRILTVREEEKKILSSDLHDEAGSHAILIDMKLATAANYISKKKYDAAISAVDEARSIMKSFIKKIKNIAVSLRPESIEISGIDGAIRRYLAEITENSVLKAELNISGDMKAVNEKLSITIFRIVQESVSNVIRHSGASHVSICIKETDSEIALCVCDNGKGFDVSSEINNPDSIGLAGIRERVYAAEGEFQIVSEKNGTKLSAVFKTKEI